MKDIVYSSLVVESEYVEAEKAWKITVKLAISGRVLGVFWSYLRPHVKGSVRYE